MISASLQTSGIGKSTGFHRSGEPRRWLIVGTTVALGFCASVALGLDREVPFEASVTTADEFVRSGPGTKFYPTGKLKLGDRVTVRKAMPGGWLMIDPPQGSFSWISAEYVDRSEPDRGVVNTGNAAVRVGSSLGDVRDVFQKRLSKGDPVEILGEKSFPSDHGVIKMLRIRPPAGEFRWISEKSVAPAEQEDGKPAEEPWEPPRRPRPAPNVVPVAEKPAATPAANDPLAALEGPDPFESVSTSTTPAAGAGRNGPSSATERDVASPFDLDTAMIAKSEAGGELKETTPVAAGQAKTVNDRLGELDEQFRSMVDGDPRNWDLAAMQSMYDDLDREAALPGISNLVARRKRTLAKYEKWKQQYETFHRVSSEAKQRDAQLASLQRAIESGGSTTGPVVPSNGGPFPSTSPAPAQLSMPAAPLDQLLTGSRPGAAATTTNPSVPAGSSVPMNRANAAANLAGAPQFAGAGIVQPNFPQDPNRPSYVLRAVDGRLLAYLEPAAGLDLSRWVGHPLGLVGQRSRNEAWNADVIAVRSVQPIQLKTPAVPTPSP